MFAYVHHVVQSHTGHEGINAFRFDQRGGQVRRRYVEIDPPGGNTVVSYLELELVGDVEGRRAETLLLALAERSAEKAHGTTTFELDGVGRAEFHIAPRLEEARTQEWEVLTRHLSNIIE